MIVQAAPPPRGWICHGCWWIGSRRALRERLHNPDASEPEREVTCLHCPRCGSYKTHRLAWGAAATYQERMQSIATPEHLRPPARLFLSDVGLRSAGPFSGLTWHRVDCHVGYLAGERWLMDRVYHPSDEWLDAEGIKVRRWRHAYTRAALRGER